MPAGARISHSHARPLLYCAVDWILSVKVPYVSNVALSSTRPEHCAFTGTLTGVVVNVVGNAVVDAGTECVPAQAAITDAVPPSEVQRPDSPSGCSKLGAPLQSGDA